MANESAAPRGIDGSCTPRKITSGRARLGVAPCTQRAPTRVTIGPINRNRFDWTRIKSAATAKNPRFLMASSGASSTLLALLRRRIARARLAFFGIGQDDHHLFQPRKVHGGFGLDRLVDTEIALFDLLHARHRNAARKAATKTAGDEHISHVHVVRALHVFDARRVLLPVTDAAHEAARAGALDHHVDTEAAVHGELHVHLFTSNPQYRSDRAV